MGNSLFDQLNKTGLVDKNKAKQTKKQKHRQAVKQKGKKAAVLSESQVRAARHKIEQAERDRLLNQKEKQAAEKKAIAAQIKQLIEMNRIEPGSADEVAEIAFNFVDGKNVQRLHVTESLQRQLVRGRLAIVKTANNYCLVPIGVADKIKLRDSACVMDCEVTEPDIGDEDDLYADFKVPDDLMW